MFCELVSQIELSVGFVGGRYGYVREHFLSILIGYLAVAALNSRRLNEN